MESVRRKFAENSSKNGLNADIVGEFESRGRVPGWQCEKLISGLCFFLPECGTAGNKFVPCPQRCLKGWRKIFLSLSETAAVASLVRDGG